MKVQIISGSQLCVYMLMCLQNQQYICSMNQCIQPGTQTTTWDFSLEIWPLILISKTEKVTGILKLIQQCLQQLTYKTATNSSPSTGLASY